MNPVLELRGIGHRFGTVQALRDVDFFLGAGEFHALLGENGAGKSTLMRVAGGLLTPDAGSVSRTGRVALVHQHFSTVPTFTVLENVALAAGWSPRQPRQLKSRFVALCRDTGLDLDPDVPAGDLPVALQQRVELLKALATGARTLLLDEPTAVLAPAQAEGLFRYLRSLRENGLSIVLVTHRLEEAMEHASRITVLRRGRVVFSGPTGTLSRDQLTAHMIGSLPAGGERAGPEPGSGQVVLKARGLTVLGNRHSAGIRDASFEVHAGEIVGIAGLEGEGQRELLRACAGLMAFQGELNTAQPVSLVPEDRTREGLILEFTLDENLTLGLGAKAPWVRGGSIDRSQAGSAVIQLIGEMEIAAPGPAAPAGALSGGNQQRLLLGRALLNHPRLLILEQPARGLDLGGVHTIYRHLYRAAAEGAGILLYSPDLDELRRWCDRILVVSRGRLLDPGPVGDVELGRLLLGVGAGPESSA